MAKIEETINTKKLSLDFIAGIITSQGYFGWVKQNKGKQKVAVFQIRMDYKDKDLIFSIRNSLGLKEAVYEYNRPSQNKIPKKRHISLFLVRRREIIKKIIIPAFNNRLFGLKKQQFNQWKEEFYKQEKKWRYHYVERLPKAIQSMPESLNEDFKPKIIGTEKL